jgi:hypothetical protein
MSDFIFLYRNSRSDEDWQTKSPEEMQKIMQKWMGWMKELEQKGKLKDAGQPLEPTGQLVRSRQKGVTDGPFTETKDIVGGYSIVQASDLAEAVELSKGCPIFEREDGAVEVRPVMKMSM